MNELFCPTIKLIRFNMQAEDTKSFKGLQIYRFAVLNIAIKFALVTKRKY